VTAAADQSQQPSDLTTPTRARRPHAGPHGPRWCTPLPPNPRGPPRSMSPYHDPAGPSPRPTTARTRPRRPNPPRGRLSGDHTGGAPPVPIPNTAVKPAGPMIVPLARKSVTAGVLHPTPPAIPEGSPAASPRAPGYPRVHRHPRPDPGPPRPLLASRPAHQVMHEGKSKYPPLLDSNP
jgi:hypothetical protein